MLVRTVNTRPQQREGDVVDQPSVPEVRFDNALGMSIYPRPALKEAVLVSIPRAQDGSELPTVIWAEWEAPQVFYGDYYGIVGIVDGRKVIIYGSAKEQWEHMHTQVQPGFWVKTAVPTAYQATGPCRIVTLIPDKNGDIREANYVLDKGDWIVRQSGGEVQHVKAAKYGGIYYSQEEAAALGLTTMSAEQFAEWAVSQVRQAVPV